MRLFVLSLLITAASSEAQTTPLHLDGHLLLPRTDTLAVYLVLGNDTTRLGTVEDRLTVEGASLVRLYSEVLPDVGVHFDTMVSVLSDLRPRSFRARSTVRTTQLVYDSTSIKGWIREDGVLHSVNISLSSPVYEGVNVDLIARASPLTHGLQLSIPAFVYGTRTISTIRGGVIGEEDVEGHPCWIVRVEIPEFVGRPETPVTLWIDRANRVLRRLFVQRAAAGGFLYLNQSP
jgi:hypothetical protein